MPQHPYSNGVPVCGVGSGQLFNGFFEPGKRWDFRKEHLVDARARRVFELMGRACDAGVYPYQLPLEGRSFILFKHTDVHYLVQCSVLFDVLRTKRVVTNCYEVR